MLPHLRGNICGDPLFGVVRAPEWVKINHPKWFKQEGKKKKKKTYQTIYLLMIQLLLPVPSATTREFHSKTLVWGEEVVVRIWWVLSAKATAHRRTGGAFGKRERSKMKPTPPSGRKLVFFGFFLFLSAISCLIIYPGALKEWVASKNYFRNIFSKEASFPKIKPVFSPAKTSTIRLRILFLPATS